MFMVDMLIFTAHITNMLLAQVYKYIIAILKHVYRQGGKVILCHVKRKVSAVLRLTEIFPWKPFRLRLQLWWSHFKAVSKDCATEEDGEEEEEGQIYTLSLKKCRGIKLWQVCTLIKNHWIYARTSIYSVRAEQKCIPSFHQIKTIKCFPFLTPLKTIYLVTCSS